MNESVRKILSYIGIIVAIYIAFKFILPLLIGIIALIFKIVIAVTLVIVIIMLVIYILDMIKNR